MKNQKSLGKEGIHKEKPLSLLIKKQKGYSDRPLVAHACNSSDSGGRDQEDCNSKPGLANSS
jgi:hypothetical protein